MTGFGGGIGRKRLAALDRMRAAGRQQLSLAI